MKTRQQIEHELIDLVRQRQDELQRATDETSGAAEQGFLKALQAFTALVIDGKLPDDYTN